MPLQKTLDSLENLHEDLHDLYEEKEGQFYLKPPEGFIPEDQVEDTKGLKAALQAVREEKREEARKRKALEGKYSAIDIEKYEKLLDAEAHAEEQKALEAGEFEKIKVQMVEKHQAELAAEKAETARLRDALSHEKVEKAAVEAISKAGGNVELLKPHILARVKLNDEDFSLSVTESDGTPKVDGEGKPVSLEVMVSEMRDQDTFKGAFAGTTQSGSGSEPAKDGKATANANGGKPIQAEGLRRGTMTERQKIDFERQYGLDALLELPQ
jgi:hypothetical protein